MWMEADPTKPALTGARASSARAVSRHAGHAGCHAKRVAPAAVSLRSRWGGYVALMSGTLLLRPP